MTAVVDNLDCARAAAKLSEAGLTGKDLGARLGLSARDADTLAGVGNRLRDIAASALTGPEILLLRSVAACERQKLARLDLGSVTSFAVACAARKGSGWPAAVSARRLRSGRYWCTRTNTPRLPGLGLIDVTGNGYIRLTALGWLVVQAIEAASTPSSAAGGDAS